MIRSMSCTTALLVLSGCASFPVNDPLTRNAPDNSAPADCTQPADNRRYAFDADCRWDEAEDEDLFVALSLSGGGARAAAFAFGVLDAMEDVEIGQGDSFRTLLDEVDVVSSVSGGSFVAGYWAAHGKSALLRDFPDAYLYRDLEGSFKLRLFWWPPNWFRLMGENFKRVDLFSEFMDTRLYKGAVFDDLDLASSPFFMINATHISRGARFDFTQNRFDQLCSDLGSYSLARAVTASAAVPIVSSPITLQNHGWRRCDYTPPAWVKDTSESSPIQTRRAETIRSFEFTQNVQWIHLFDGGVADNLGLQGLYDDVFIVDGPETSTHNCPDRVAVIVVDAVASLDHSIDQDISGPNLFQTFMGTVNTTIDRLSDQAIADLPVHLNEWSKNCEGSDSPDFYRVLVRISEVGDEETRQELLKVPTALSLPKDVVQKLEAAGREVFNRNAQCLVDALAAPTADAGNIETCESEDNIYISIPAE